MVKRLDVCRISKSACWGGNDAFAMLFDLCYTFVEVASAKDVDTLASGCRSIMETVELQLGREDEHTRAQDG
jgi:hypothetical protein